MSESIVSQAVGAVVAALSAAPAVSGAIGRVRLRPWSATQTSAIAVRPESAEAQQLPMQLTDAGVWDVRLSVECYARSYQSQSADAAVDAVLQPAFERLMSDTTLGGKVRSLWPERVAFDYDVDAEQTACAAITFTARMVCGPSFT